MLRDLLNTVAELDCGRILVVASDEAVFEVAHQYGAISVCENEVTGYNPAVLKGFDEIPDVNNVAVLPGDIPLASVSEIAALVAPMDQNHRTIRLATARDFIGTNGLFLSSKNLISPCFGVDSFANYHEAARAIEIEPSTVQANGMAHDIDTPIDLRDFARIATAGATLNFLNTLDIPIENIVFEGRAVI
jgi:2-phospho-L-lactate guanylyltransferase